MFSAKVVGTVVATHKDARLVGSKLLVVQPVSASGAAQGDALVAVDSVGAGVGELVLVVWGSAARAVMGNASAPVDAAIVGIIDRIEVKAGE